MRKCLLFVFAVIAIMVFSSCGTVISNEVTPKPTLTQNIENEVDEPAEITDYAEILLHSDDYEGINVLVAGRIADFPISSSNSFYFRDRLGFEEAGIGFEVELANYSVTKKVSDYYKTGDYVLMTVGRN